MQVLEQNRRSLRVSPLRNQRPPRGRVSGAVKQSGQFASHALPESGAESGGLVADAEAQCFPPQRRSGLLMARTPRDRSDGEAGFRHTGFKRFHRDVAVIGEQTEIRVVLLVTGEASGRPRELTGTIVSAKNYAGMRVVAFPLAGDPSDVFEARVGNDGRFEIAVLNAGPYLLTLMQADRMLGCKSIYIGPDGQETQISVSNQP